MSLNITISEDNTDEIKALVENAINRGLKSCGETAVGYAKQTLADNLKYPTGNLMNSIVYQVDGHECYIGTNVHYAPYVEFGTGKYAETGGRMTPWAYQDDKGNWYTTEGMRPVPFIRPSASGHTSEYMDIMKDSLENA